MKNTKMLQNKVPRLQPLNHSILLQPLRLNRNSPQWAEPQTTREAVTQSRVHWEACRQLATLTMADFRTHIAKDFQDLPFFTAEGWSQFHQLFKSILNDSLFWGAVEDADRIVQDTEEHWRWPSDDYDQVWNGQYFRERFTGQPEAISQSWVQIGLEALTVLHVLRFAANANVNKRSRLLRSCWEQGKKMGLLAAVQEELPARWVIEAVAHAKQQVSEGDIPEIRRRARAWVKKIAKAEKATGKGNTEHLPSGEKPLSKRRAVSLSKAIRRLESNYKRGMEAYHDDEKARREVEGKFKASEHIKDSHKKSLILQGFHKRIKAF
ncbi:MAG: hypothetical protein HYZ50_12475 [Deltaproteobacteria bacterium]|nr:hypothetical protein [Deltaproteobacteria bacterium]